MIRKEKEYKTERELIQSLSRNFGLDDHVSRLTVYKLKDPYISQKQFFDLYNKQNIFFRVYEFFGAIPIETRSKTLLCLFLTLVIFQLSVFFLNFFINANVLRFGIDVSSWLIYSSMWLTKKCYRRVHIKMFREYGLLS